MSSLQYFKVVVSFISLTELMRFSVWVLCCEVFKFWGKDFIDFGIRSGKSLSLGMPKAPQGKIKGQPKAEAWGCPGRHPLFRLHLSVTLLGAIFLFTTRYLFCLEHLVWYESLLFILPQSSLLYTPFGRDTHESEFIRILYVFHLYLLS